MQTISENACFGGTQGVYRHASAAIGGEMTFGLYLPPAARTGPVPVLWVLAGLTCTHENAMVKAGAQALAAAYGLALVFPDTSPRGDGVADDQAYDLGQGAGFYLNATRAPWAPQFAMWDYLATDLPAALADLPLDMDRQAITGHSMGGHGALTLAMGLPGRFASASAFAPICNPSASVWGRPQLTSYLGEDETAWRRHDASLALADAGFDGPLLIDTGTADPHLDKLRPETLAQAMAARRQPGAFRMQAGYDHSYFFVSTFMADHIAFHVEALT